MPPGEAVTPTAMQCDASPHDTSPRAGVPSGAGTDAQLVPASSLTRMSPGELEEFASDPTAMHRRAPEQEMACTHHGPPGTRVSSIVDPPSVVRKMAPEALAPGPGPRCWPPTTHTPPDPQPTALDSQLPGRSDTACHDRPPSIVRTGELPTPRQVRSSMHRIANGSATTDVPSTLHVFPPSLLVIVPVSPRSNPVTRHHDVLTHSTAVGFNGIVPTPRGALPYTTKPSRAHDEPIDWDGPAPMATGTPANTMAPRTPSVAAPAGGRHAGNFTAVRPAHVMNAPSATAAQPAVHAAGMPAALQRRLLTTAGLESTSPIPAPAVRTAAVPDAARSAAEPTTRGATADRFATNATAAAATARTTRGTKNPSARATSMPGLRPS